MLPTFRITVFALLLCAAASSSAVAGAYLYSSASCATGSLVFSWQYTEDAPNPVQHPEWVGYDVLRRASVGCDAYVRVNAESFPRVFGQDHGYSYTETPPSPAVTYEYRVILVDANRQQLSPIGIFPSSMEFINFSWASCPEFSAPLVVGTLADWGWTRYVEPCAGTCQYGYYLSPPWPAELEAVVGTNTVVRLYGAAACGTVEGCALTVDHWDLGDCAPLPARRTTWGRLKAIHR